MGKERGRLEDIHGGPPPETLLRQEMDKAREQQISGQVVLRVAFMEGNHRGTTSEVIKNYPANK